MTERDAQAPPDPPAIAELPPGYRQFARFLRRHPRLRAPSIVTIVIWIVVFAGVGILRLADAHTTRAVAHVHNISACTLGVYLRGQRDRSQASAADTSQSPSVRARARGAIPDLNVLISSQIPYPASYDCSRVITQRAQGHQA